MWTRERAAIERLQEEMELLEEEFRRVHTSFLRMAMVWEELAARSRFQGYIAYARRLGNMYSKLALQALKDWKNEA